MSWPTARASIVAQLNGLALTVTGHKPETLNAYEFAPDNRQDVGLIPFAYVIPVKPRIERHPGAERETVIDEMRVRVILAPTGEGAGMESLHRRYDGWWQAISAALDDAVMLDGGLDVWNGQEFEGLQLFDDIDRGWGFEMVLRDARFTEVATFTP